ncbi:MAG: hypothetical protein KDD11_04825 [Acidobacteria bacterium]|nr:hypothetical protein [Acidobacteriota bacterium]
MSAKNLGFEIDLGGGLTVTEAAVTVYRVTSSRPEEIYSEVVHESRFAIEIPGHHGRHFYAVAEIRKLRGGGGEIDLGDREVQLLTTFQDRSEFVTLSERLTVATTYSFARFLEVGDGVVISDWNRAFHIAQGIRNTFVQTDGSMSEVILRSPNGLETNSLAMFNFLSNLVYYSLTTPEVYAGFLRLTRASSLLEGLHHLVHDPFIDPPAIYGLIAERQQVFHPSLPQLEAPATPIPDQWTLTVKRNDSGAENFMIAGVGYLVFDKNDRAWLANNVRQGTPNSSTFTVILEPDGSPAPFSPLFGGGILGAGFGIAVDPAGETIYIGNYGWGPTEWNPQHGSVSVFSCEGRALSPSNGYTNALSRVQGMTVDADDNLWMASWGTQDPMPPTQSKYNFRGKNSAVVVYLEGDPERALVHHFDSPHHLTFDVAVDDEGCAYVSNSGKKPDQAGEGEVASSVYKLKIEDGELKVLARWISKHGNETLRQITVGPDGDVYVVAVATSRVIRFDRDLCRKGEIKHNVHGPWGIVFDTQGTMFVSNFAREMDFEASASEHIGPFGVTVVQNSDARTAKLMTVPTGGHEVMLANGLPLYGNPETSSGQDVPLHSYDPIMRLTSSQIDRAGNLWACNNWKPSAVNDVIYGNPGGDGVVIFVGIAEPAPRT